MITKQGFQLVYIFCNFLKILSSLEKRIIDELPNDFIEVNVSMNRIKNLPVVGFHLLGKQDILDFNNCLFFSSIKSIQYHKKQRFVIAFQYDNINIQYIFYIFMSAQKQQPSHKISKPVPEANSTQQQFQVLDCPKPNPQVQPEANVPKTDQNKQQCQQAQQNRRVKSNLVQDELLKQQKQEDALIKCPKCQRCIALSDQLNEALSEKQKIEFELKQTALELAQLKRSQREIKLTTVDKSELEFSVSSLKEIIQSYEEDSQKLTKFIYNTMKMTEKSVPNKTISQIVESIVTDFMINWHEVDRELNSLITISSPNGEAESPKEQQATYNYYATVAKIQKLRQNIVALQKLVRE